MIGLATMTFYDHTVSYTCLYVVIDTWHTNCRQTKSQKHIFYWDYKWLQTKHLN